MEAKRNTKITIDSLKKALNPQCLRGADLRGECLRGADLRGADLYGTDLREADLRGADLSEAYMRCANLYGADLRETDLRGADLREAYLSEADLRGADLSKTTLCDANMDSCKMSTTEDPTSENDAMLIAAAPELLEACREFVRFSQLGDTVTRGEYIRCQVECVDKAMRAIAKVEGEPIDG